MILEDCLVNFG